MKRRLNIWIMSGVLVFVGAIIFNMFNVSVAESDMYQKLANQNQFGSIAIHANRGSIYDANGQILAQSATVFNIILDPTTFRDKDSEKFDLIYSKLQELFNTKKEDFEAMTKKTGSGARYQVIAKKVEKPTADLLTTFCKENKISCISILQDTKRYYPQGDLAASVIGFLDGDGNGQYGLEAYYDDYLAGVDGRIVSARDAQGNEMPYRYEKTFDAKDGNSLVLTIDATLQHYLEKGLKEGARLLLDGRSLKISGFEKGYFLGPTIFEDVHPQMEIAREESFGPVANLIRAQSLEQVIEWINTTTEYGHSACLITESGKNARKFIRECNVGNVGINAGIPQPYAFFPLGSKRQSFFGAAKSRFDSVRLFLDQKTVTVRWV